MTTIRKGSPDWSTVDDVFGAPVASMFATATVEGDKITLSPDEVTTHTVVYEAGDITDAPLTIPTDGYDAWGRKA